VGVRVRWPGAITLPSLGLFDLAFEHLDVPLLTAYPPLQGRITSFLIDGAYLPKDDYGVYLPITSELHYGLGLGFRCFLGLLLKAAQSRRKLCCQYDALRQQTESRMDCRRYLMSANMTVSHSLS